jgi:endonuclease
LTDATQHVQRKWPKGIACVLGVSWDTSGRGGTVIAVMRLIIANCEVIYTGRLNAYLPLATRLVMLKADGTVMVWSDRDGYKVKPLNWMTAPTSVEELGDTLVVRKLKTEDVLEIRLAEVLSDVVHDMGESAALQKDGVERDLQEELAAAPASLGEELTLVKREWPTEVGPVDLMCRADDGEWVAVEIKRIGTIEAVEQLTRYLGFIREDPAKSACRGILAAQRLKPQAIALAESRGIRCVEVDLALLRGEREPDLTLFRA